jgi:methionyl-tRNA synthetase
MAKLISDRANHQALKCVLSALRSQFDLNVVVTSSPLSYGAPRVPYLIAQDLGLFCANEMAKLVHQHDISPTEVAWIEWERSFFSAAVAPLYNSRKMSPLVREAFVQAQNLALPAVKGSELAEMVLWCSMLPAFCEGGLLEEEERSKLPQLLQWFSAFYKTHGATITEAFNRLGVQEEADFLRVRRQFALTPPSRKPFYVTTPIYYVNASPHIGHVYSTLVADTIARYHRLKGEEVYFCTGTDEHGQKVAQAAAAKNMTPMDFTTEVSKSFRDCFSAFNMKWDHFIRTTDAEHKAVVQQMWRDLESKGDIYLGKYEGWYCVSDEAYLTELNVKDGFDREGKPAKVSIDSGHPCIWMTEESYKFRLSKFQEPLLKWLKENKQCIVPEFRRQEVIKFVEGGLLDLSVSRRKDQCSWGIEIPGNDKHVVYVWLDALSNYYTASKIGNNGEMVDYETLGRWPADLHVIGKDILKFHAVYWPAFLMSAGLPLPKKIIAHGWWTKDHQKISKSLGNAFDPLEKGTEFGLDALKYFLLRDATCSDDGDYSDYSMVARLNGELADTLGNLLLRCVSRKINPAAVWPAPGELTERDQSVIQAAKELPGLVDHYYLLPDLQKALMGIFDVLRDLNQYATENAPWKLVTEDPKRNNTVLFVMMEALRVCIVLLSPVLVDKHGVMLDLLGVPAAARTGCDSFKWGAVAPGTPLGPEPGPAEVVFPKVDPKKYPPPVAVVSPTAPSATSGKK